MHIPIIERVLYTIRWTSDVEIRTLNTSTETLSKFGFFSHLSILIYIKSIAVPFRISLHFIFVKFHIEINVVSDESI